MKWYDWPTEARMIWIENGYSYEKCFDWDNNTISLTIKLTDKTSVNFTYEFDGVKP